MFDLFKKNPKVLLAQKYEEKAGMEDKRSKNPYGSDYKKLTHGQISKLYEKAGDLRAEVGDIQNAKLNYNLSIENVYNKKEESRLKNKIVKLSFKKKRTGLENYLSILAIGSFIGALFFISFNLTGSIIVESTQNNFTFGGISLFILGLVFTFIYFKNKK